MRIMGFLALIPTSVLLTAAFFVLFAVEKVAGQGLRTFGKFVAVLLIIIAALIFSKGVYTVVTGKCPMMKMMQEMCPMMGGEVRAGRQGGMRGMKGSEAPGVLPGGKMKMDMQKGGTESGSCGTMKK